MSEIVYVVIVEAVSAYRQYNINCDYFKTLQDAQVWVESRGDKPHKITPMYYESETNNYKIYDLRPAFSR